MKRDNVVTAVLAAGAAIGAMLLASPDADAGEPVLPVCAQEDGNVDGKPCLWSDPDTGREFFVSSENYR